VNVQQASGLAFGKPEGGEGLFEFVEQRAGLGGGRAGGDEGAELEKAAGQRELRVVGFVGPFGGAELGKLVGPRGGLIRDFP